MLFHQYEKDYLQDILVPCEHYRPFPTIEERKKWDELTPALKKFWINKGEGKLNYAWPDISATLYMDYTRTGNRSGYDTVSWSRRKDLASLVIAECIENHGRFLDDIINGIWCICEETFWGIPGNGYMMRRKDSLPDISDQIIELFSAETAALLSWTHYLLKTKLNSVSMMVCERIQMEVKKRILNPYLNRTDFWWMGLNQEEMINNWNPWCNSNCLASFLLLEDNPERRQRAVTKVMSSLDKYLEYLHSDGGCEEGPKYWMYAGGKLFDCLELLYGATGGKIDLYSEPLVKNIGSYLYKVHIDESFYANFADSPARVNIPAALAYLYGRRIGDKELTGLGAMALRKRKESATDEEFSPLFRILPALFHYSEIEAYSGGSPFVHDAWLDGIQIMIAREQEGSSKGLYLAAKGGHNGESHNHNDIGNFIIFCDGTPVIIDPGILTYTSKSFFGDRYTIWAMQSAYHNLPLVNGTQQMNGSQYRATDVGFYSDHERVSLTMNISGAYPDSAGILTWNRSMSLIRNHYPCIIIKDDFKLQQASDDVTLIFMTPYPPRIREKGSIILQYETHGEVLIEYNSELFLASSDIIPLDDEVMKSVWGDQLYRIKLNVMQPVEQAENSVRIYRI